MAAKMKELIPSCSIRFKDHYLSRRYIYPYEKCKVPDCVDFKLFMKKTREGHLSTVNVQVCGQISHPGAYKHKRHLRGEKRHMFQREMASKKPSEFFYEKVDSMDQDELVFGNQTTYQSRDILKNAAYEYNAYNVNKDHVTEMNIIKHAIKESDVTSQEVKCYVQSTNLDHFSTLH